MLIWIFSGEISCRIGLFLFIAPFIRFLRYQTTTQQFVHSLALPQSKLLDVSYAWRDVKHWRQEYLSTWCTQNPKRDQKSPWTVKVSWFRNTDNRFSLIRLNAKDWRRKIWLYCEETTSTPCISTASPRFGQTSKHWRQDYLYKRDKQNQKKSRTVEANWLRNTETEINSLWFGWTGCKRLTTQDLTSFVFLIRPPLPLVLAPRASQTLLRTKGVDINPIT